MPIDRYPQPPASAITPRSVYLRRRDLIAAAGAAAAFGISSKPARAMTLTSKPSPFSTDEKQTPLQDVTHYNNFYEFGTGKEDPGANAGSFKPLPWTLKVDGLVAKPRTFDVAALMSSMPLQDRIYRMRCVEAWSMVIPWVGFPLAALLKQVEPRGSAKYVAFETVVRPSEMVGQRSLLPALPWPYVEGLRLDEAMNPLTLLAVGLYGETLPNQNGAPIRLVTPWKYGFKGIKSIVRMSLVEQQPVTSWNREAPDEYGFYANVNPQVDHPRWSQASERIIGGGGFFGGDQRKPTLMFNGYGEQVASMYAGMNLRTDM